MFYTYNQNNSGGGFDFNPGRGISHYVVVEADSSAQADERAQGIGVYFDEDYSIDCDCCGTRWSAQDSYWGNSEGDDEPKIYDTPVAEFHINNTFKWIDGPEIYVHYADGRVEGLWETK